MWTRWDCKISTFVCFDRFTLWSLLQPAADSNRSKSFRFAEVFVFVTPYITMLFYFCHMTNRCQRLVCVEYTYVSHVHCSHVRDLFFQGASIAGVLHSQQNYRLRNYQTFVRIFSLQIKQQPINIAACNVFTFSYQFLNSVCEWWREAIDTCISVFSIVSDSPISFQLIATITLYVAILIQFQTNEGNVFARKPQPHWFAGRGDFRPHLNFRLGRAAYWQRCARRKLPLYGCV